MAASAGVAPQQITLLNDIVLAGAADPVYSGTQPLTVEGDGYTLDGNDNSRILHATATVGGSGVTLQNLTVTNGSFSGGGAGGGVWVFGGTFTVIDSVVTSNTAPGNDGGGLAMSHGTMSIIRSTLSDNYGGDDAGGATGDTIYVESSTISGNTSHGYQGDGAGLQGSVITIVNSTVTGNVIYSGTGPYANGGGGVRANTSLTIRYSTITDNSAPSSKGGDNISAAALDSTGSVVADARNRQGCAITGSTTSSYSYDDDGTCGFTGTGDTSNGSGAMLGSLADNGGPTLTQLPAAGSPLIDAVTTCIAGIGADQRGIARPQPTGGSCDIGAVEVVQNRAPTADAGGPYSADVGETFTVNGSGSTDPDGDSLTYTWEFNGTSKNGVTASFTAPATAGIYEVSLTVDDGNGGTDSATAKVAVYDTKDGFATAGGWILSPEGAYVDSPTMTGKATFEFSAKYVKKSPTPVGNLDFNFEAAGLAFHSNTYDWLVVTDGDYAQVKGTGTVNEAGTYLFKAWVGDGGRTDPDTFRIKIWTTDGTVIYDNLIDQTIGAGAVMVHE